MSGCAGSALLKWERRGGINLLLERIVRRWWFTFLGRETRRRHGFMLKLERSRGLGAVLELEGRHGLGH